jgi:uncharacterized membrane protein/Mg-chelatase subunit ChlD
VSDWPIQFEHPAWLWSLLLWIPIIWLGRRSMVGLGPWRQWVAIALRVVSVALLAALLARPLYVRKFDQVTVVAVLDRSQSVPNSLQEAAMNYLTEAVKSKPRRDQLAVVNSGEAALIASLPDTAVVFPRGEPELVCDRTDLAAAVRIAMAIFPGDTAKRIVLISDGNENVGNLREAATVARGNEIPIDVLPIRYEHGREVVLERLTAPHRARVGQTVALRCVLRSTKATQGKLLIEENGAVIDLDPDSSELALPITLDAGLNVASVLVPLRSGGTHRFRANFAVAVDGHDALTANNSGAAVTFVASHGRVLISDADGRSARAIAQVLAEARIDAEYRSVDRFPSDLLDLMQFDAAVLVDTPNSSFSLAQQDMLSRYVQDIGGGLVMVGGPDSFGAGGWIGSPVEEALPVELDPPQREQMPKGALVLIMHSVEMPRGNYWGEQVAVAAARSLSRLDLVGLIAYDWNQGGAAWVHPLSPAGDKTAVLSAIRKMQMGDMPDFGSGMEMARDALAACDAGQKHMVIISDGDPTPPSRSLLAKLAAAKITATGVAVFPHSPADVGSLQAIARATGGRFYNVKSPSRLPQIFIKEAQVVRRPLIIEQPFTPRIIDPLSELTKGIELSPPRLDGYVLTAAKKGLVQTAMVSPAGDPILACRQFGIGKTVAFTSDASSRWAETWLTWARFAQFWEQVVRWSMRAGESSDFQVVTDLEGQRATVHVEARTQEGGFANFLDIEGAVIDPDLATVPIRLQQVGPGRYQGGFAVSSHGTYVVNLHYRDDDKTGLLTGALVVPFAPEFRELKDNTPLLAEVARITGGRLLAGEPEADRLFDHGSLVFPHARKDIWRELAILWLVLFLADVAVRRVALDFVAAWQRFRQMVESARQAGGAQPVVEALREHQLTVRQKLRRAGRTESAGARYEPPAGEAVEPSEMPIGSDISAAEPTPAPTEQQSEERKESQTAPTSYLDRLRQAKHKARESMQDDSRPSE